MEFISILFLWYLLMEYGSLGFHLVLYKFYCFSPWKIIGPQIYLECGTLPLKAKFIEELFGKQPCISS